MNIGLEKITLNTEVISWLRCLGQQQAKYVLECIAKVFQFAEKERDFFQGCGLYVAGSSLGDGNFNDIDIILVGLDFRAVVEYDNIFLMDPETLIQEEILVEPQCFLIMNESDDGKSQILKPVTDPDAPENIEAFGRMGLEYKGVRYDYNIDRLMGDSLTLEGFCSYHASQSYLVKELAQLLCPTDPYPFNCPFDNYGCFNGEDSFLVYRFPVENENNCLPGARGSVVQEIKPIDFCIHAENLYAEAWKNHQSILGLPYLTLMEWPKSKTERKIITDLGYPRFIDPSGTKRAKRDSMFFGSYNPGEDHNVVIES